MAAPKHRLLIVRWLDSAVDYQGWVPLEDIKEEPPTDIASVGWELHRTKDALSLAQNVGGLEGHGTPQACNIITIPLCCIVSEKVLRG